MKNISQTSERLNQLSSSQRLLLALDEAVRKLEAVENEKTEPIAIIGMSCRFPGGANTPEAFWQLLVNRVDAITEVPPERWSLDAYFDPNPDAPGKTYTRHGGFLQQVDQFDAQFFGISPREAVRIDPQQRLLLEVSWEAMESAGLIPNQQAVNQTGVFVGITTNDYARLLMPSGELSQIDAYYLTGNPLNAVAGRLSYTLGLQGPCMAIDTACSSSLVSVHVACQSLRNRECTYALAGGVNLILSPENTVALSKARMLSADGRCKTFDAEADGIVRGEGCGVLVLKRLSDAIADEDNILALIRGSAVNQDGPSSGFTVPNKAAQENLIRQALARAKVEPFEVNYVEAHGTGTALGDPIEVRALGAVLGEGRSPEHPLKIGSVKTNVGHLESAVGVAGLIKVVLSLQHQQIPPHLHLKQPNPYINWHEIPVAVATELVAWPTGGKRRIAGVSAFGASGTNAHIILESAPTEPKTESTLEHPLHLLTLSTKTKEALQQLANRYEKHLAANPALTLGDICFTANTGREHFNHRLAVLAGSAKDLSEKLAAFSLGHQTPGVFLAQVGGTPPPKVVFLYTGQGSQYVNMGRQLYEQAPTFRAAIDRCAEILRPELDKPLLEILYPPTGEPAVSTLNNTVYTQPALFALEYALFQLWKSWGIEPDLVMGHSVGEYVAACVARVFSLESGLKLIAARGRLMQALPLGGEMVAVMATPSIVAAAIAPYAQQVAIAAINGPENLVISGEQQAVRAICTALAAQGVKTKTLQVSHAFHSPLMAPMLNEFQQVAAEVTYSAPRLKLIANLTGQLVTEEIATPEYWCRHLLNPVQFAASFKTLQQQGYEVFVEIGPQPTLLGMGRQCVPEAVGRRCLWLPSLRAGKDDWQQLLQSVAQLHVRGVSIDWVGFDRDYPRHRVVLPTYPFQRQRYWVETALSQQKTDSVGAEVVQSPIVSLIQQGDTAQLAQVLTAAGQFSPTQQQMLPQLLEVLVQQHQQQATTATITDWLYQIQWQPKQRQQQTVPTQNQVMATGRWLILTDAGGVGQALANQLQQQGHNCLLVYAGNTTQRHASGTWSLNPTEPADWEQLVQEVAASPSPWLGVVHLWSLEIAKSDLTLPALEQAQRLGCGSVLYLVQALVKQMGISSPRLWLVTRGAMPVGATLPAIAQVPMWGIGRVVSLEHPELFGGMVDLDPLATAEAAVQLLLPELDAQGEDQLAFRQGQRYTARLVRRPASATASRVTLCPDSSYLIAGGLGALGLHVAQWLVAQGARHLVLIGRREASPSAQAVINQMQQVGAKVRVMLADISSLTEMTGVLSEVKAAMPPLKGIVQAAGVVGYQALQALELETLESVLRPKVLGSWILHQLTQEINLDFFVCFSSIAAVWGSKGQAHYAAANLFLDGLAHYRHQLGMAALSVNWGPWAEGGMASIEAQQWLTRMGVSAIAPAQGLAALGYLLSSDAVQTTVAKVNWSVFKGLYEARGQRLLLEHIQVQPQAVKQQAASDLQMRQRWETVTPKERQGLLIEYLQAELAQVLGFEPTHLPQPQQGFFEMGMDSLMALELKQRLEASLGVELPATLAFESPTIKDLAEYLAREVLGWESPLNDQVQQCHEQRIEADVVSELEQLNEDEVGASIAQELAELEIVLNVV